MSNKSKQKISKKEAQNLARKELDAEQIKNISVAMNRKADNQRGRK